MKILFYTTLAFTLITGCKEKPKSETNSKTHPTLSIAEKIANAHGFKNWQYISKIQFTFNKKRNWVWQPKNDSISLITEKDTINYFRKNIDSLSFRADENFINDKFWLLIPFQLVWDKNTTISQPLIEKAPISQVIMNKIVLTYSNDSGGYTPGDAYDIYYNDDFLIKEWAFRKGNQPEPSLTNTFENYKNYNGLLLASDHKMLDSDWNLTLSNIKVILN
ncbi:hypothetical protein [uncultured Algibacter sp.]|uniref:hypothetical protein n=1 Tax=uncultured Algibacter sp. TaxID=298659 RepID=UPI0026336A9A|nr:hypothetical protein [uncultured Algibacter sp.]